jgi:hypothetical protein
MLRLSVCAVVAGILLASLSASAVGQQYGSLGLIDRMLLEASQEQQPAPIISAGSALAYEPVPEAIPLMHVGSSAIAEDGLYGHASGAPESVPSMLRLASHEEPTPAIPADSGIAPQEPLPTPVDVGSPEYSQEPVPAGQAEAMQSEAMQSGVIMEGDSCHLWTDLSGVCCNCCDCGLYGGLEGTFLFPIGEPVRTVKMTNLKTGKVEEGFADPGLGAGLRAWGGIQRCGCGFRVQYWHLGANYIHPNPVVPKKVPAFDEAYYLQADTLDIELTRAFCCGHWRIDTSFGGRYARLQRNATVVGYGTAGGVDLYGLAMGAHELEGSGFTFSIGTRTPLHFCCGLNFYFTYRGSVIWADAATSVLTEANAISADPVGAANSRDGAFVCTDNDERLYISELQLGLQYERCIPCCGAVFFVRGGMEYQHWNTGDLAATSSSYAFLQGGPPNVGGRVDAAADAHQGTLDLIGFVLGAGITY